MAGEHRSASAATMGLRKPLLELQQQTESAIGHNHLQTIGTPGVGANSCKSTPTRATAAPNPIWMAGVVHTTTRQASAPTMATVTTFTCNRSNTRSNNQPH
jgi:hypothetical protein